MPTDMPTPRYVLEAVTAYMEGKPEFLENMFENRLPLASYPESREIISNCILGKSNRPRGRRGLTREEKDLQYRALMLVAELHGAGLGVFSNGGESKITACDIASEYFGISAGHIYKKIWKPNKESDAVKQQIELGRNVSPEELDIIIGN